MQHIGVWMVWDIHSLWHSHVILSQGSRFPAFKLTLSPRISKPSCKQDQRQLIEQSASGCVISCMMWIDVVCCGCSDQCKMAYFNSWPWTCLVTFLNYSDFDAEFPARQNVRRGSAHGLPSRRSRCLCRRTVSAADGDRPLPARRADPGLACPVSSSLQIYLVPTSQNGQMFAV